MKQQIQIIRTILAAVLSVALFVTETAYAQDAPPLVTQAAAPVEEAPAPLAPPPATSVVPTKIANAHTIFLSNLGADTGFPIDNNSYYNAIYDSLRGWGKYQLVGTPEDADLIFELRGVSTYTEYAGNHGSTYTLNNPSFALAIIDAKTQVTLWTTSAPVYLEGHGTTLTRWVHIAEERVVSQVKLLSGQQLSATESADLITFPKSHGLRNGLIVAGSLAVMGLGIALIVHHETDKFNQDVYNGKEQQYEFCINNGFPPGDCVKP